jgi:hypothetical protein
VELGEPHDRGRGQETALDPADLGRRQPDRDTDGIETQAPFDPSPPQLAGRERVELAPEAPPSIGWPLLRSHRYRVTRWAYLSITREWPAGRVRRLGFRSSFHRITRRDQT